MYRLIPISLVLLAAVPASAVDITSCGQTVADGDIGELQNDLVCSTDVLGVRLERRTTLRLNGHTITGGSAGVLGPDEGRFKVEGPGVIAGAEVAGIALGSHARATVSDLTVQGAFFGIEGTFDSDSRSRVKAVNVVATANTYVGIQAMYLSLQNVDASGNTVAGIQGWRVSGSDVTASNNGTPPATSGWGYGVFGSHRVRLQNLVANGNNQAGVLSTGELVVRDGTVTGNNGELGSGVDLQAAAAPRLRNVTCGLSDHWGVAGVQPWGVCAGD